MIQPEKHFNEELTRYQRDYESEIRLAELEDQRIDYRVQELMEKGGSCHPWTIDNIFEAFSNMGPATQFNVSLRIGVAEDLPNNHLAQETCAAAIRNEIRRYWENVAYSIAKEGK